MGILSKLYSRSRGLVVRVCVGVARVLRVDGLLRLGPEPPPPRASRSSPGSSARPKDQEPGDSSKEATLELAAEADHAQGQITTVVFDSSGVIPAPSEQSPMEHAKPPREHALDRDETDARVTKRPRVSEPPGRSPSKDASPAILRRKASLDHSPITALEFPELDTLGGLAGVSAHKPSRSEGDLTRIAIAKWPMVHGPEKPLVVHSGSSIVVDGVHGQHASLSADDLAIVAPQRVHELTVLSPPANAFQRALLGRSTAASAPAGRFAEILKRPSRREDKDDDVADRRKTNKAEPRDDRPDRRDPAYDGDLERVSIESVQTEDTNSDHDLEELPEPEAPTSPSGPAGDVPEPERQQDVVPTPDLRVVPAVTATPTLSAPPVTSSSDSEPLGSDVEDAFASVPPFLAATAVGAMTYLVI